MWLISLSSLVLRGWIVTPKIFLKSQAEINFFQTLINTKWPVLCLFPSSILLFTKISLVSLWLNVNYSRYCKTYCMVHKYCNPVFSVFSGQIRGHDSQKLIMKYSRISSEDEDKLFSLRQYSIPLGFQLLSNRESENWVITLRAPLGVGNV